MGECGRVSVDECWEVWASVGVWVNVGECGRLWVKVWVCGWTSVGEWVRVWVSTGVGKCG